MNKKSKILVIIGALNVIAFNGIFIAVNSGLKSQNGNNAIPSNPNIACQNSNINEHHVNASLLKWNLTAADSELVKTYEAQIQEHASTQSINEFNDLYDNNKTNNIWNNYGELAYDLTHTKIGNHTIDVDWIKMYQYTGCNKQQLQSAQDQQLRFYNIFAKVFSKNIVLKLVQKVEPVSVSDNVVAWTAFNPYTNNQWMGFGPDFVNTNLIKTQYDQGFWSSNNIISVSTHEYGHALSNFIGLDDYDRDTLNENWYWNDWNDNNNNNLNVNITAPTHRFISSKSQQINNRTHYLIDYFAKKAHLVSERQKLLFSLVIVDSNYGRIAWKDNYDSELEDEFFAESFASWLLTPVKK